MQALLIRHPRDAVVHQGQAVEFCCETDQLDPVNWKYRLHGSEKDERIVTGGGVGEKYRKKFRMITTGNVYTLTLINASVEDSGTYSCIDTLGLGESVSAQLIVLGKYLWQIGRLTCISFADIVDISHCMQSFICEHMRVLIVYLWILVILNQNCWVNCYRNRNIHFILFL